MCSSSKTYSVKSQIYQEDKNKAKKNHTSEDGQISAVFNDSLKGKKSKPG